MHLFKNNKYKVMGVGDRIKFTKSSKYDYDFKKGQAGTILRVISPFPSVTDTIYQILPDDSEEDVWAVGSIVEPFEQLSIEDYEKPVPLKKTSYIDDWDTKNILMRPILCSAIAQLGGAPCIRTAGHAGLHMAAGGMEWETTTEMYYRVIAISDTS